MSGLQRRLVRLDALAIALGSVIGVGVFINTAVVLRGTPSFAAATALWIVVGLVCASGSVLYTDLSARVPEAGGPYAYVRVAFGRPAAFVYGWMNGGVAMPVRQASVCAAIGGLIAEGLGGDPKLWASLVLVALLLIHLLGVRVGAMAQRVLTTGKILTLTLVIVLAAVLGATGSSPAAAIPIAVPFATAVSAVWYTYLGWQDVVLLAEELREPRRDLPFVLVGTVLLVIVLYTCVHLSVYLGLGGSNAAYSQLPARAVAIGVLGAAGGTLLTALTLSSMVGGAAESMMVRPRIAMALGRDGLGPRFLAYISQNGTPAGAMIFHSIISLGLVATGTFVELLSLLAFAQGFLGIFETASYFAIVKKRPEVSVSRFHPWAPLLFIAANITLLVLTFRNDPQRAGIALAGIAVVSVIGRLVLDPSQWKEPQA